VSTRAHIKVEGEEVLIYKHSDGYPDGVHGVLAWLQPIVTRFVTERGSDEEYLLAQIIRQAAIQDYKKWLAEPEGKYKSREPSLDPLGWGLGTSLHGDIEFLYVIKTDGKIEVHEGDFKKVLGKK